MTSPPQFLYFDLGNVLLRFCNDQAMRQIAALAGCDPSRIRDAILGPHEQESLQWRFERGDFPADGYYEHFCRLTGNRPNPADLAVAVSDMFTPIDETFQLVAALHAAGHRLGVLSNTNPLHWGHVTDGRFPGLPELFEQCALSYEAHSMKPDAAIYHYAARLSGLPTNEVFFADDRAENVAGALAVGMDAVQFTSTLQLMDDLRARGINW